MPVATTPVQCMESAVAPTLSTAASQRPYHGTSPHGGGSHITGFMTNSRITAPPASENPTESEPYMGLPCVPPQQHHRLPALTPPPLPPPPPSPPVFDPPTSTPRAFTPTNLATMLNTLLNARRSLQPVILSLRGNTLKQGVHERILNELRGLLSTPGAHLTIRDGRMELGTVNLEARSSTLVIEDVHMEWEQGALACLTMTGADARLCMARSSCSIRKAPAPTSPNMGSNRNKARRGGRAGDGSFIEVFRGATAELTGCSLKDPTLCRSAIIVQGASHLTLSHCSIEGSFCCVFATEGVITAADTVFDGGATCFKCILGCQCTLTRCLLRPCPRSALSEVEGSEAALNAAGIAGGASKFHIQGCWIQVERVSAAVFSEGCTVAVSNTMMQPLPQLLAAPVPAPTTPSPVYPGSLEQQCMLAFKDSRAVLDGVVCSASNTHSVCVCVMGQTADVRASRCWLTSLGWGITCGSQCSLSLMRCHVSAPSLFLMVSAGSGVTAKECSFGTSHAGSGASDGLSLTSASASFEGCTFVSQNLTRHLVLEESKVWARNCHWTRAPEPLLGDDSLAIDSKSSMVLKDCSVLGVAMKVQSQSQLDWEGGILTATTSPALDVSGQGSQAHLHRVSLSRLYHPPDAPEVCSIISAGLKGRATLTDCYLDQAAPAQQCEGNEAKDPRTPPPAQNEAAAGEALRLGDDAVQVHPVRTQAQQPQITVAAALSRGRVELVRCQLGDGHVSLFPGARLVVDCTPLSARGLVCNVNRAARLHVRGYTSRSAVKFYLALSKADVQRALESGGRSYPLVKMALAQAERREQRQQRGQVQREGQQMEQSETVMGDGEGQGHGGACVESLTQHRGGGPSPAGPCAAEPAGWQAQADQLAADLSRLGSAGAESAAAAGVGDVEMEEDAEEGDGGEEKEDTNEEEEDSSTASTAPPMAVDCLLHLHSKPKSPLYTIELIAHQMLPPAKPAPFQHSLVTVRFPPAVLQALAPDSVSGSTASRSSDSCAECGAAVARAGGGRLQVCAGCRSVRYCSTECSHTHWRLHKPVCRAVAAGGVGVAGAGKGGKGIKQSNCVLNRESSLCAKLVEAY